MGTDYAGTYRGLYGYVYSGIYQFQTPTECLYYLLNWLAKFYSRSDYTGVFALSSLVICAFAFAGLRNQSKSFFYGVALFILSGFYYWSFNVVRQSIAMSIFIYSLQFLRERKPLPYMACALLATGFHSSALLYFPLYFINDVRIHFKALAVYSVICACGTAYLKQIALLFTNAIPAFQHYASRYLTAAAEERWSSSFTHVLINLSFYMLFVCIAWLYDKKREHSNIWINFQALSLMFSMLGNVVSVANRLSRLFEVVWMISIPCMTGLIKNRSLRLLVNAILVASLLGYLLITYFVLGYHGIIPYRTVFNRA